MILGIIGSRTYENYKEMCNVIEHFFNNENIEKIVSGGADGADSLGIKFAKDNRIEFEIFPPKWRINGVYDPTAGFKRNRLIVEASECILAFWDGKSKGTKNSLQIAKELKKPTFIYYFEELN